MFWALVGLSVPTTVDAARGFEGPLDRLLVERWTVDDGLPTNNLTDLHQTRDGFLWIASFEGLLRFDGLGFEVFDRRRIDSLLVAAGESSPALLADSFFALAEDGSGGLWIAGQGGQTLYYREGRFRNVETTIEGPVFDLCVDRGDRLWSGGLWVRPRVDGSPVEPRRGSEVEGIAVESIACAGDSTWLGTNDGQVLEFRRSGRSLRWSVVPGHAVDALIEDPDGGLWVGHRDGLSRWQPGSVEPVSELAGVGVFDLAWGLGGQLWLATTRGLGRRSPDGSFAWLDGADSGLREAHALAFDHEGSLWVAARRQGLFRLTEPKVRALTSADGLPAGAVGALAERASGEVVVGGNDALVTVDEGFAVVGGLELADLGAFEVLTLAEDVEGRLWAGSYLGLLRFESDLDGRVLFHAENGFPTSEIRFLLPDPVGGLWVGTGNHGVLRIDGEGRVLEILDREAGLISDFVFALAHDAAGNLLIALRGGLHQRTTEGGLETLRSGVELPGSLVFSVRPQADGSLWLATDAGLVRIVGSTVHRLDRDGGLPTDAVFDVVTDARGALWISSSSGLLRGPRSAVEQVFAGALDRVDFEVFDETDGMSSRHCTGARHMVRDRRGRLWVPTLDGVTVVDPTRLVTNPHPPPLVVHGLWVEGEQIPIVGDLALDPGPERIELDFAVLSLRNPEVNQARYRLQGFDSEWLDAGLNRRVRYTGLPPGSYVLRVTGSNDDGLWNRDGAQLAFEVRPFFHQTWVFRAMLVLATALVGFGVLRWRQGKLQRSRDVFRALSEQRQSLITDLERRNAEIDRYLYIFSHDFKNPLLTIRNFAGRVDRDLDRGSLERARDDLGRITEAAGQLNRQLDDLLKVATVGRSEAIRERIAFAPLVDEVTARFFEQVVDSRVIVSIRADEPEGDGLTVLGDRRRLAEAIEELLDNALKHSGASDPLPIEVGRRRDEGDVVFWVRDRGRGIEPAYHHRVFQPLEQLDPQRPGTGIGLALVARVVEEHGGLVWIKSDGQGRGATIGWRLPPLERQRSGRGFEEVEP